MKKFALALVFAIIPAIAAAVPSAASLPSFADLVEKLSPAVVNISTTQVVAGEQLKEMLLPNLTPEQQKQALNDPRVQKQLQGKPRTATSLGSGFIVNASGIIVTNNHVIASGTDITVTLHDDTKLKAKIIGRDSKIDVAVLKIEAGKPLPFVKFGSSDTLRVGDWIIAIGNPYGLGGSVSAGIISAKARDINVGPFDDFLQTDAAINRGNSGGPMFNTMGEVVGVNTAIFSPSGGNVGIGFATPASLASPVIEQIIKFGRAKRAWLGVKIQTVTDEIASSLGMKQTDGALVLETTPNSPAAKSGLKEGDVIVKFNGQSVAAMRKLPRIVAEAELNTDIPMEVYRNGKSVILQVVLTEMTAAQEQAENATQAIAAKKTTAISGKALLGMKLAEITPALKIKFKLAQNSGLLVAEVAAGSNAADNAITAGNVITKAGQIDIVTLGDFQKAIIDAKKAGRTSVLLLVETGNGSEERFVPISIK